MSQYEALHSNSVVCSALDRLVSLAGLIVGVILVSDVTTSVHSQEDAMSCCRHDIHCLVSEPALALPIVGWYHFADGDKSTMPSDV
jgi:hypothetical protein